tara:strand:+ start:137 stop:430 length:294 start_codon:yes stop_codon:yes gene_type:complete
MGYKVIMKKNVNGKEIKMTANEIAEFESQQITLDPFEISLKNLRLHRNKLLQETDYLALSDQTLTDEMKKYRQDLRDITKGLTTEKKVKAKKFPTKP